MTRPPRSAKRLFDMMNNLPPPSRRGRAAVRLNSWFWLPVVALCLDCGFAWRSRRGVKTCRGCGGRRVTCRDA